MTASVSIIIAARTACSASSEYGGRRSTYGSRSKAGPSSDSDPAAIEDATRVLDIFPSRTFPGRVPEERGRVVRDDQGDTVIPVDRAAQLRDGIFRVQERLGGKSPEGDDDLGPDDLQLP